MAIAFLQRGGLLSFATNPQDQLGETEQSIDRLIPAEASICRGTTGGVAGGELWTAGDEDLVTCANLAHPDTKPFRDQHKHILAGKFQAQCLAGTASRTPCCRSWIRPTTFSSRRQLSEMLLSVDFDPTTPSLAHERMTSRRHV
jgi:hypothetical protein